MAQLDGCAAGDQGIEARSLDEALLMSTNNICFHGKIRKMSIHFDRKTEKKKALLEL